MKLTSIPNQHPIKVVDFPRLDGGLNLWELDYRLSNNQSPEMKNLWWQDGVLQCRDGQEYLVGPPPLAPGENPWTSTGLGLTCTPELFWGYAFYHNWDALLYLDMTTEPEQGEQRKPKVLYEGMPENRGTFFRYNDYLFYKNRGGFYRIEYTPDAEVPFAVTDLSVDAYVPVILMNASPVNGSGDEYQPENRLSPKKTVKYNAAETTEIRSAIGNGASKEFALGKTAAADYLTRVEAVYFGENTLVSPGAYTANVSTGKVTFTEAPATGTVITFVLKLGVVTYKLPVSLKRDAADGGNGSVEKVVVDGKELKLTTDYKVSDDLTSVVFTTPPPVHDPMVNNTVEITYSLSNEKAAKNILDCTYATVYGGSSDAVIVLAGSEDQPNAFFWNSNDSVSMNASYWPVTSYNLAGDSKDGITGFGHQYNTLIVLKGRSVGRVTYDTETLNGRETIALTYETINSKIGCDLPWTIQLIENNVVFCNTSGGVFIVRDSSSALENNIVCISRNVNGTPQRRGLLYAVQKADKDVVCSVDDDNRYWLCADGHVYLWDYVLSDWKDPSWFYFDNIYGVAFMRAYNKTYLFDTNAWVIQFGRFFMDHGRPIEKVYQFPPQFFDTYDRLKDIMHVIFTIRSDTDSEVQIEYQSDYETRRDLTTIQSHSWRLSPRNLSYRDLRVQDFAFVARRKPGCRHVRHFSMRLYNNEAAQDLAILSAQIYFRYLGRDK